MPNKKVITLLFFLVVITFVILLLKTLTGSKNITSPTQTSPLTIISPISSSTETSVTEQIKIKFNKPVDPKSLKLELFPANEIELSFDSTNTELTVNPTNAWGFSTNYFIKITKETKSQDGESLDSDYTYSFKTYPYSGI